MTVLRLIADDLTGALDSAAAFASVAAPVPVRWTRPIPARGHLAFDSGTREAEPAAASARLRELAALLAGGENAIRYKKIDSLLRGREAEEIGAVLDALRPETCVLAPAFPAQNRVTRAGRQFFRRPDGEWRATEADLGARLEADGRAVRRARAGDALSPGITLFDAETDADLDRIAGAAATAADILWIGSGGLAAALARRSIGASRVPRPLPLPILGLFGTDHDVMRGQLVQAAEWHVAIDDGVGEARHLGGLLKERDAVFVSVSISAGTPRDAAASRIEAVFGALVRHLDPPGTLVVSGGETLRRLCGALGADGLDVLGEILPGIPRAAISGGRWAGTAVISKSGAFGSADILRDLVAMAKPFEGIDR